MLDITVDTSFVPGATLVRLAGELGIDSAPALRITLSGLIDASSTRLVVDLAQLRYCDSIGLSDFMVAYHRCTSTGGYLRLAAAAPLLLRILVVVGLLGPIPVYDSVSAACAGDPAGLIRRVRPADPAR